MGCWLLLSLLALMGGQHFAFTHLLYCSVKTGPTFFFIPDRRDYLHDRQTALRCPKTSGLLQESW